MLFYLSDAGHPVISPKFGVHIIAPYSLLIENDSIRRDIWYIRRLANVDNINCFRSLKDGFLLSDPYGEVHSMKGSHGCDCKTEITYKT